MRVMVIAVVALSLLAVVPAADAAPDPIGDTTDCAQDLATADPASIEDAPGLYAGILVACATG